MSDTVRSVLQATFPALSIPETGEAYRLVEADAPADALEQLARIWPGIQAGDRVLVPTATVQLTDVLESLPSPNSDTFDGTAGPPNPAVWGIVNGGAALDGSGHLSLPQVNSSVVLADTSAFTGKAWQGELLPVPGASRGDRQVRVQVDPVNFVDNYPQSIFISQIAGILQCKAVQGSEVMFASPAYDPTAHRHLRLREDSGTVYAEVSPDGAAWTAIGDTPSPGWLAGACKYTLLANCWGGTDPGPALFDSAQLS